MTGRDERQAREDAEWRAIVENFGERAELPDSPPYPETPHFEAPDAGPAMRGAEDATDSGPDFLLPEEDHFVPPPPPPVPRPRGLRLVAWLGLFGVPASALLCIVFGVPIPSLVGLIFIVWFVGGFGYLVATMSDREDPGDGWDDGAVL